MIGCICGGILEVAAGAAAVGAIAGLVRRHQKKKGNDCEGTCESGESGCQEGGTQEAPTFPLEEDDK